MKKLFFLFVATAAITATAFSQLQYETIKDYNGEKILKGIISRDILANDSSFKWYRANLKAYPAGKETAANFGKHKDSIQLVIFLGTWCEDSHVIIPKLFPFLDAAGFSNDHITLIAVDRNKKTISHLTDAFDIKNVPTVIVMKDGKELGRVVEYGRHGAVENELTAIVEKK